MTNRRTGTAAARNRALPVLLVVLATVAAGCGARVSHAAREAVATNEGLRGAHSASNASASAAEPGAASAATDSGGSAGNGVAGNAVAAASGAGGSGSGSSSSAGGASGGSSSGGGAQAAAFTGDNGGATDVGVTATDITLGNVSTLSGPVPGLFQGAVLGTQAAIAYINSQGGIFGRKLKVVVRDDAFDAGQNRAQTLDLIPKVFALTGSFSLFDDSSAAAVQQANIPDIGYSLSRPRQKIPNNFSPQPLRPGWRTGALNYYKAHYPDAIKHVGTIVGDVQSAKDSWAGEKAAMLADGYHIDYERDYEPTETNFTADVVRMRANGVKMVVLTAADVNTMARFVQTMQQQQFHPDLLNAGGAAYDPAFLGLAGSAAEGLINDVSSAMYLGEDAGVVPEVALLDQWEDRIHPGAKPDIFAVFGWASVRLLQQALMAVGPKVTRPAMLKALGNIHKFDSNGLLAPGDPAGKGPASCYIMEQVHNGKWQRFESPPPGYRCNDGPFYLIPGA